MITSSPSTAILFSLFISCPKGLEYLLEDELNLLGVHITRVSPQGVYCEANLILTYELCVWSRLANRIQLILFSGKATDQNRLYDVCYQFSWNTVFTADKTLAIEFHGSSPNIRNAMFGAQVVKDGVADYFRQLHGTRPTIDRENPQIRLHAYLKQDTLTLSLDLTGYSMHQRGYRTQAGSAPLKENIAAAMLLRAKWPQRMAEGAALHDPFCGAGTIVIEAAMMAARMAPGLLRHDQSLHHWVQHQPSVWKTIRAAALQEVKPIAMKIQGTDTDAHLIRIARANAERAGVLNLVEFNRRSFNECSPTNATGLLICNPPYGERLGDLSQLIPLYQEFGRNLHANYQGWQVAILTSNPILSKATGLRATKQYTLYNGALECKLYCVALDANNQLKHREHGIISADAQMLANRLQKNASHLQKWAKRNQISCYRVYDADLPEYAYAIDIYHDHAVLQEYVAPPKIPSHKTQKRSLDVMQVVPSALGISSENIVIKQRKPQKGTNQYQKVNQMGRTMEVREGKAKFTINLYDYLDTGLFLDHRPLRFRFAQLRPGTRFLNCFCYTATASVHAALSGAYTTNVDLSNTYLRWAEDNFRLNNLDVHRHQFIQYDCLTWLKVTCDRFDVIFLDPPSFSNSKRMTQTLDIQRDHTLLIDAAMCLLNPDGTLYFSTNSRQFKLSPQVTAQYTVHDISTQTIDIDFKRNKRIHRCFMIRI